MEFFQLVVFSYCGYANAVLFEKLDDNDINAVEEFVRNDLLDILLDDEQPVDGSEVLLDDEQMKNYFGELYASSPSKFRFMPGDRKFIKLIQNQIQLDIKKKGRKRALSCYTDESVHAQKLRRKRLINVKTENETKTDPSIDSGEVGNSDLGTIDMLATMLYTRIQNKLAQLRFPPSTLTEFNKTFVSVVKNVDGNIDASVVCFACYLQSETKENVHQCSVFLRTRNGKQSWVISNFTKHLNNKHKDIQHSVVVQNLATDEDSIVNYYSSAQNLSNQNISLDSIEAFCDNDEINLARMEKTFNMQISKQVIKMWEIAVMNSEDTDSVQSVCRDGSILSVEVVPMPKDGDCLYSAIIHQQCAGGLSIEDQTRSIQSLRADVVAHIQEHFDEFLHELRGHVYELKDRGYYEAYNLEQFDNLDDACSHFLSNWLNLPGVWDGSESLKAITRILNVNIIIFNENGPINLVSNAQQINDRTIAIAYRLSNSEDGYYNHYDSVCNINADNIYLAGKEATQNLMSSQNLNSTGNITINETN